MIFEKIKNDVNDEFVNFRGSLDIYLAHTFDVSQTKEFLQTHIPKEIAYKSEILLDTMLNYLMADAREKIKTADIKLQNAFFDADFRRRIHDWARQLEHELELDPKIVRYTSDPRLKQGLITAGIAIVVGTSVTLSLASSVVGVIVAGIVTILFSACAFKFAYDKASPIAREIVKTDVEKFLRSSQRQVLDWLKNVHVAFKDDFNAFCSANGFALEETIDG